MTKEALERERAVRALVTANQLETLVGTGLELDTRRDGETMAMMLARLLLYVRTREGKQKLLEANAVQRAFEARRGQRNIVLKARQMGMTTWVAGRFLLKTMTQPGTLSVQVAHTREAAEGIFGSVQRMWNGLPEALREGALRRSKANAGQMVFPVLDSEFRVVSAADENAGRGLTIQNLHCSEVSRWPGDAAATLAGLRAAMAPGGELVMESTANGAYGAFYEEWQRAEESRVVRHFFPWWMEEHYKAEAATELTEEEQALMAEHGLTAEQVGYRRVLERSFRGLRAQEYAEDAVSCFRASGSCCFDVEALEQRMAEAPAPVATRRGGALQIWLPTLAGREYLVAVDTAGGGSGGDYAAVQVIDLVSGVQCAELRERLNTMELAKASAALAREYGGAVLAVERNNHGAGVLAYLDSAERYRNVYGQDGVAGWLTSAGSKPGMVSRMGQIVSESAWMLMSRRLLEECRTYVTHANGRTGAAQGAHDDCVMAMAVAQAVRAEMVGRR